MLGLGLGGFMDGFQKSQKLKQDWADAERKKVLADRQDKEYDRLTAQRDAIDNINADAKATFDAQVAAGTQEPADFLDWYHTHTVPKLTQTYLLNDDRASAEKVTEWANTHEAKTGARLFRSSVTKALSGDGAGAVEDAIKIGKLKGYINNGYEVLGQEALLGQDGAQQGYRIKLKTPDGKDIVQDVRTQDLPKLIATFGNPEAAWESQVAARAQADKDKKELETYEAKKKIDRQYGLGPTKDRAAAITSLRKRFEGGLAGDETKFDDMPRDQQEKLINDELELVQGQPGLGGQGAPAPAEKKVLVDTSTGKPVSSGSKPAAADTPQAKEEPATKPQASAEKRILGVPERAQADVRRRMEGLQRAAAQAEAPGISGPAPSSAPADVIAQADEAIRSGAKIYDVAMGLQEAGIPESEWPASLKQAIAKQRGVIGLGD
ncbi:hypothetical protein J2766_001196 [Agrobacterium tumefaciens]|uniref:Uncharacterized protein n=1 Tax=Agrobacterium tumefaciens TaxID=358 RepID=A0AAW8LQV6_AGRTU|nr:hypothetical protein [Agrobacterium tumefaciens]MBP2564637.1 hypothetical protein [Agrobacterium tumefaciens]MDR6701498.1 hypothetical protein [Agrobacterium tumefaciens]